MRLHFGLFLMLNLLLNAPSTTSARVLERWDFDQPTVPFASQECSVTLQNGVLRIEVKGGNGHLVTPFYETERPVQLRLRMRSGEGAAEGMEIFWRAVDDTSTAAWWGSWRMVTYPLKHDMAWHEYLMPIPSTPGRVQVRFDPGSKPGVAEIDWRFMSLFEDAVVKPFSSREEQTGEEHSIAQLQGAHGVLGEG